METMKAKTHARNELFRLILAGFLPGKKSSKIGKIISKKANLTKAD